MAVATAVERQTGRTAQRQQTRGLMLQAVLDIIVSDGIRAVRQRAVAERAGVSLGSTTYHFKNVEGLIVSAFQYWRDSIPLEENRFYQQLSGLLHPFWDTKVPGELHAELAQQVYRLSAQYVCDQLSGNKHDRIIELAFYHESLGSDALRELVLQSWQGELDYLARIHRALRSCQSVADARITFSLFRQLELGAVIADLPGLETTVITDTLRRHFSLCFAVDIAA